MPDMTYPLPALLRRCRSIICSMDSCQMGKFPNFMRSVLCALSSRLLKSQRLTRYDLSIGVHQADNDAIAVSSDSDFCCLFTGTNSIFVILPFSLMGLMVKPFSFYFSNSSAAGINTLLMKSRVCLYLSSTPMIVFSKSTLYCTGLLSEANIM